MLDLNFSSFFFNFSQFSFFTIKLHTGLTPEIKFLYLRNALKGKTLFLMEELVPVVVTIWFKNG